MEQMRILYSKSKLENSKTIKGFKVNVNLAKAFNLLCKLRGKTNSEYIEEIMAEEVKDYLKRVRR